MLITTETHYFNISNVRCVSQVLIAVGRDACTGKIGLDKAGVEVSAKYVSFI